MGFNGFPPEAMRFLKQIKKNNDRDWFLAHKPIYETRVKGPMIELLTALKPELKRFAPELVIDPAKSVFRIYRDVRFSADKSPYKTHIAAFLSPKVSAGATTAARVYLHIEPAQSFIAGGLYHAAAPEILAVRNHIAENSKVLRKILADREFVRLFGKLEGDRLSRVPRGFPCDHSAADLLRHKDFLVSAKIPADRIETPALQSFLIETIRAMMPLIRFLNAGLKKLPRKLAFEEPF